MSGAGGAVDPPAFDPSDGLPTGTTVLEASAGTGKTFTIAALATRYVAEGVADLSRLMLVTFGRAATQELRERVRAQLVDVEHALADPAAARASHDGVLRLLAGPDGSDDTRVAERRARLTRALADFDAATIATTHGFCQQMLVGLGMAGDYEPDAAFVEDVDDLVTEVVDDLYLRKWGGNDARPPTLSHTDAIQLARQVVGDRHTVLEPRDAEPGSPAAVRVGLAEAVRAEVDRRKRQRRLVDYDDLLTLLRDTLLDPVRGPAARARVRRRYDVVLVDEFQDTDPVQWQILRETFHGQVTLVLIGDPKQAIYAFRGGDVVTYLEAKELAGSHATLPRNWRSDAPLLTGLDHLLGQAALGDPRIVVRPVEAAHPVRRLIDEDSAAPVRVRLLTRAATRTGPASLPSVKVVRPAVAQDVAADVVRLLSGAARLRLDPGGSLRPVRPGDVAVLVRTNPQATLVHDALRAAGVPAVLTGAVDVFGTAMAREWQVLLQALEAPHRRVRARTAALGCFVGWDAERLAAAGDDAMDELGPLLAGWAHLLERRGVPALLEAVTEGTGLLGRLLRLDDGERRVTDLRHLGESLHAAATADQLGTSALVEWLGRRITSATGRRPAEAEERTRRLESDAAAVQVVTVHRSKGLEFPVVYVPYGWDRYVGDPPEPRYHTDRGRTLDVGGRDATPTFREHCDLHKREEAGEDLRLLYVALTRAQCAVVTWWAASRNTPSSPAHRLLFGGHLPGSEPADKVAVGSDDEAALRLAAVAAGSGGTVAVERVDSAEGSSMWRPPERARLELAAARFDRALDTAWRRTSYSAITAAAHDAAYGWGSVAAGVGSEPDERVLDDEPAAGEQREAPAADLFEDDLRRVPSPMAALPGGTGFGLVVHAVLENVDPSAPDLTGELADRSREVLARRGAVAYGPDRLAAAMLPVLRTPLGPLAGDRTLADVAPADRLAELGFELPLAGGDRPVAPAATVRAIAGVLGERLPADDPFAAYADLLAGPQLQGAALRGYLTGSLDAVLRLRGPHGVPRYVVVDYKTNLLGAVPGGDLTAWHYRPAALAAAMRAAHYPLQLLLYLVALHRFLRWRQPGYDPDVHLGGGLYLFVRGMCGPDTPAPGGTPCGVFGWVPPRGLVEELSDLLAGGAR